MLASQRTAETYNGLLPIREATEYLAQSGGDATVAIALEKLVELGLGDCIGLRLLHKHNDIDDDEAMVEHQFIDAEGLALITAAVRAHDENVVPNSWLLAEDIVPIEFSEPGLLCAPAFNPAMFNDQLRDLKKTLVALGVDHVLGPCINYDQHVYRGRDIDEVAFLEKTDTEHRANVVRPVDRVDPSFVNSAKTKWHAKKMIDCDGKLTWITACNCFCSVFPQGGHQGTKTHRYSAPGGREREEND